MNPVVVWVLVALIVTIGIGRFTADGKVKAEVRRAQESLRRVSPACRSNGHAYKPYATGYRCATCGNHVSSSEDELYGLSANGLVDRRRCPR